MYQLFDMNEKVTTNQPTDSYFKEFFNAVFWTVLLFFFLFLFLFFVCYCDSNLQLSIVGGEGREKRERKTDK